MSDRLVSRPLLLLGMPRSGTTWLSQAFESCPECIVRLSPLYAYAFRGRLNLDSAAGDWKAVLAGAMRSSDPFMTQNWRRETGELPWFPEAPASDAQRLAIKDTRFFNLYLRSLEVLPASQIIYIVRNPVANLWSWYRSDEFPLGLDAFLAKEWRTGACRKADGPGEFWGLDDWREWTTRFLAAAEAMPERVKVVRYEHMVSEPEVTTRDMFNFADLQFGPATGSFLETSTARHDERGYSVFKSRDSCDDWRTTVPSALVDAVRGEIVGTPLEVYLG